MFQTSCNSGFAEGDCSLASMVKHGKTTLGEYVVLVPNF